MNKQMYDLEHIRSDVLNLFNIVGPLSEYF